MKCCVLNTAGNILKVRNLRQAIISSALYAMFYLFLIDLGKKFNLKIYFQSI